MNQLHQRGSILVFSILILAVMMATSMALARIFLPKIASVNQARNSVTAIFAADSASEFCLYEARKGVVPTPLPNPPSTALMTNGAFFTIASLSAGGEVAVSDNCVVLGPKSFRFRATGVYNGVNRALEVSQ